MSDWKLQEQREEMARREVGSTRILPALSRILIIIFLLIIFSVPLVQHISEIKDYAVGERQSLLPQAYDVFSLLPSALTTPVDSGSYGIISRIFTVNRHLLKEMNRFEEALDDQSVIGKWIRPKIQYVLTAWLGAGNEKAYCGEKPWLFYRPGVDYLSGHPFLHPVQLRKRAAGGSEWVMPTEPDPRVAIIHLKEQLARRGIALIIMPTPIKAMIHPEKLSHRYIGRQTELQNPSYDRFKEEMERECVLVFDVASALMNAKARSVQAQYLVTDTHWRPETVELVAEKLKDFIREKVILPMIPDPRYRTEISGITQLGDLAVMLDLLEKQQIFPQETVSIRKVYESGGEPWQPQKTADVLMLGDSFSNIYSLEAMGWGEGAGLVEQLSYALQRPLDRITRNDNGSFATREALSSEIAKGRDRLAGKRLVIYQFAIRELAVGNWKSIDLKLGTPPQEKYLTLLPGDERLVRGRVEAVSAVPRPGTVAYKDHVMAIHLADLEAADGRPLVETEAMVYMRSMIDNVWTPAARYQSGNIIELRLTAWSDVAVRYEGINRSEMDDQDVLIAEPCWGETMNKSE